MEGNTAQITADLLQLRALGASHVVLSTQTNDMARFRWEIETLAAHVLPQVSLNQTGEFTAGRSIRASSGQASQPETETPEGATVGPGLASDSPCR
jgi:hypothetical protein